MALRRARTVQGLPGSATGGGAESQSSMIGHINFEMKQPGKPSAGNPHAGFDVAGAENRLTVWLVRHSQRKRGAMDRPDLRGDWRQSSTLLMSGDGKRGGAPASVLAPILDSTGQPGREACAPPLLSAVLVRHRSSPIMCFLR